ncbi:MAG: hypothetical protein CMJ47_04480 [Planctomyces sp.]|nr:hypothetical protein [Planctomyces sp.]
MKQILQIAASAIRQKMGHDGHLRLNVMLPISSDTLEVVYTFDMDHTEDCDDRLQFRKGCGACGTCWEILDYVICDLADASVTYADQWKMDKYQQRLVRRQLTSLLCVPLFNQKKIRKGGDDPDELRKSFVGVLNIDSDDDILDGFRKLVQIEDSLARHCAAMITDRLTVVRE